MLSIRKKQSTKTIITILLCIFNLFLLSTIAYSAFSSTMNITGMGYSRVEADVRITDFSLYETSSSTTSYEEFSKNTISSSVSFQENGSVTYKIDVTNYGDEEVGILSITGFPENTSYELIDYNLKDKICNNSGKCNNYATKSFYLKVNGNNTTLNFTLTFDFRVVHQITYTNFTGNYISAILDGDSIEIDLSYDNPQVVGITSDDKIKYTYKNGILKLNNVTCDIEITAINDVVYTYSYTGNYQTFTAPYTGMYKVELWGASGDNTFDSTTSGGLGGYTSGEIRLDAGTKIYIYVGSQGTAAQNATLFNNGTATHGGVNGGGSTDIRITSGSWNNATSINSRIMVAGAGGVEMGNGIAGAGGGLLGYSGGGTVGGTQISYGAAQQSGYQTSSFGIANGGCTGGNGYYPAGGSACAYGSGGGSSFISGHNGCIAITSSSSITPRKSYLNTSCNGGTISPSCSYHYSNYRFLNTKMIDGEGYCWTTSKQSTKVGMPNYNGTGTMIGNTGNGYAKITLLKVINEYSVSYTNISGDYPTSIEENDTLTIKFINTIPSSVLVLENGNKIENYTYSNGILSISNVQGNIDIVALPFVYDFSYTGSYQTFTPPVDGIYKIELWGAQGGNSYDSTTSGGLGGYTSGNIELTKNIPIYLYIGQQGTSTFNATIFNNGTANADGWNGGGATDIRVTAGAWNNSTSIKSRIMVAAGGGTEALSGTAGAAGGLLGYSGGGTIGATQTYSTPPQSAGYGSSTFGIANGGCTGGNGYYAAGGAACASGSGGGSSFISGHNGCVAITSASSTTPRNDSSGNKCTDGTTDITCSYHYSGYKFTDTVMIDGQGYPWTTAKQSTQTGMPNYAGTGTMVGNTGNGYAKISLIGFK